MKINFYFLDDININVNGTNRQLSSQAEKYLQAITSNGVFSLIAKPTRVTYKSATIINHIITNDVQHTVIPFVIQSSITDHYVIMCKNSKIQTSYNKTPSPLDRNKKNFCAEAFFEELGQELSNLVAANFLLNRNILLMSSISL